MNEEKFVDELNDLVTAGLAGGLSLSDIIAALELRLYALQEEEAAAEEAASDDGDEE